jgi:hypothetical protein
VVERRTKIQTLESNDTDPTPNSTKVVQSTWNSQNSGGDLCLDEDHDCALPGDGSVFHAIDVRFEDLAVVV